MTARKPIAKKATTKATAKKTAAKKTASTANSTRKIKAVSERYNKTQILNQIAENTELSKKQVQAVLDELSAIIEGHVKKLACGEFVLPGLRSEERRGGKE